MAPTPGSTTKGFIVGTATTTEAVRNTPTLQVIFTQFDAYAVAEQDTNVILPHLTGEIGQNLVIGICKLNAECRIRKGLDDGPLDFNFCIFLFWQIVALSSFDYAIWPQLHVRLRQRSK